MTREEFIKILDEKGYSYEIIGDKISVDFKHGYDINLESLETIPPNVEFNNYASVWLDSLKSIPPSVKFNNHGGVYLKSLIGGGSFSEWKSKIDGIGPNPLLNGMIKRGIFL